jgi:CubicO group peptidase (beta-lactamase class C family)
MKLIFPFFLIGFLGISLMPKRLIDPGEISSYSNFGVALAGFVLEHVDGRPFPSIMEEDIFLPLGMVNSSFDPGDVQLQKFMTGYHRHHSGIIPLRYDFIQDSPAGTMVTTIDDIVTFMKLILKPEGLESAGVLSSEMQRNMLSPQFTHHPDLNHSIGFLWSISEYHGQRAAIHDGGYLGTAARLFLFPDCNRGLCQLSLLLEIDWVVFLNTIISFI